MWVMMGKKKENRGYDGEEEGNNAWDGEEGKKGYDWEFLSRILRFLKLN